ncbi:MAG: succinyl-diaminopimelate desuccinylase [Campylobacterales bacterium]
MSETIELLKKLIACPSVTPNEAGTFAMVRDFLPEFRAELIEENGIQNLWLTRKNGPGPHLCFAGHLDVVPPGEGWSSDPFMPLEEGGFITGRGAQDMKAGAAAFLVACKHTPFNGTLSVLLTADEEGDAIYGTQTVLKRLRDRGELPDMAVVAEPTCEKVFGDTLKVGRRGSINGTLIVKGKSGHVAYPEKCVNPIELIAPVLHKLAGVDLDAGDEHFAPSKLVITDIRGGYEVVNLTPGSLKIMFNVRNSTATDRDKLESYVRGVLGQAGINDYELTLKQSSFPFVTRQGKWAAKLTSAISAAIEAQTGVRPKAGTGGGTSDARYFGAFGIDVVEFGPVNDRIHAANERVPAADVEALMRIFSDLIGRLGR